MKEPWKKSCNGKVVITLNDEKATTPTEVEVPVDLSWSNGVRFSERKSSTNKTIVLVAVLLVLGLTVVTLFKVQNLVYSTSYMNWRMQELESAVNDGNDDVKLIKYKLSLDESNEARAEALIGSIGQGKSGSSIESQDLKLSESQNRKLTNSLSNDAAKDTKESEVHSSKGLESEKTDSKESMDNDAREHPNPADPEEWIKPLVEILEDVSNHPLVQNQRNENSFFKNVLELLAPPKREEPQEPLNDGKIILNSIVRVQGRPTMMEQAPEPFDFLKKMLPTDSNIKIIHFNERAMEQPQQPQPNSLEEEMAQRLGLPSVKILSPFDGINKSPVPIKFFAPAGDKQEQPIDEIRPKIMIKSVRVKMVPLPFRNQEDFSARKEALPMPLPMNPDNIEVFRVNQESPEPSQEVEAPKMSMGMPPFPFPFNPFHIEDILRSIPASAKNIKIFPMGGKQEDPVQSQNDEMAMSQAEKIIPEIHELIMKTLTAPPADQNPSAPEDSYSPERSNVEVSRAALRQIQFPQDLMESLLPIKNYDAMGHVAEEQQPPNQDQQPPQEQPQQPQQQEEVPRPSTKLTPVTSTSWGEEQTQYPEATPQN